MDTTNNLSQFIGKAPTAELWAEIHRVLGQTIMDGNGTHTVTIETYDGAITNLKIDDDLHLSDVSRRFEEND